MILDTSVIVCIFLQEPGYEEYVRILSTEGELGMGTPTLVETGIVLTAKLGPETTNMLVRFMREFRITEIPFSEEHWPEAVSAYAKFGKDRHPAKLNFGDCLSYATAKLAAQHLLYTGDDFAKTDCNSWC